MTFRLSSGTWQGGVMNALYQFYQEDHMTDTTIGIGKSVDAIVCVHGSVMAAASPYLRECLADPVNKNPGLDRLNPDALIAVLKYCYSGELKFKKAELGPILEAATLLKINQLVEELARYQHCFLESPDRIVSRDGCVRQPDIDSTLYLPSDKEIEEMEVEGLKEFGSDDMASEYSDSEASTSEDEDYHEDISSGENQLNSSNVSNSLPDLSLPCEACGKRFKQKGALGMHYKSHLIETTNDKGHIDIVKCKACESVLAKGVSLVTHLKVCTQTEKFKLDTSRSTKDLPFHCLLCNNRFEQGGAFGSHMKIHMIELITKDNVRVGMRCKMCQGNYQGKGEFMDHTQSCPGRWEKRQNRLNSPQQSQVHHHVAKIKCTFLDCSYVFESRTEMLKHCTVHHGKTAFTKFKGDTKAPQSVAKRNGTVKQHYVIPKLETKSFSSSHQIFKCHRCHQKFNSQSDCMRHKLAKHNFICGKCGKKLLSQTAFDIHKNAGCQPQNVSNGPFVCNFCQKVFVMMFNLQKHYRYCLKRIGSAENAVDKSRMVRCELCHRQLSCRAAVEKHKAFCKVTKRLQRKGLMSTAVHIKEEHVANSTDNGGGDNAEKRKSLGDSESAKKIVTVNGISPKVISPVRSVHIKEEPKETAQEPAKEQIKLKCDLCSLETTDETKYTEHKRYCTDTWNCEACGLKFKTSVKYSEHKDKSKACVSPDDFCVEEIHPCGACPLTFSSSLKVLLHAKDVHNKSDVEHQKALALSCKETRQCQLCKAKLNKSTEIYYHHLWQVHGVKSNINSRYYQCNFCSNRYIYPREFEAHEASHAESKERHECHLCKLKFRRKQLLEIHMNKKHAKVKQE